jgi:hypothetical protein
VNNFVFHNPTKILFGKGTITEIGKEIRDRGIRKVLFLYGGGSIKKNGVYDTIIKSLKDNSVEWVEVSGVVPNPVLSKVHEGVEVAKREKVEAVLAVGGGSVADSGKAIAAGFYYDGDIWDAYVGKYNITKALPLFVVLTLSATGSEMNGNSVITNEKTKQKFAIRNAVYPTVSIIDPSVQFSLPKQQVAYGAVDIITHVLENYFDHTRDTEIQDRISESLVKTVINNTKKILQNPYDYEARAQFAWCGTLALNGLTAAGKSGGDWASHRIEHSLSALYGIAHGAGLSIISPAWMKYVYKEYPEKFLRFAEEIFGISEGSDEEKILKGIDSLKNWYKKIGAPISLKDANIPKEDIEKILENVCMLPLPLGNIKKLYKDDIREILKIAAE